MRLETVVIVTADFQPIEICVVDDITYPIRLDQFYLTDCREDMTAIKSGRDYYLSCLAGLVLHTCVSYMYCNHGYISYDHS